MRAFKDFLLKDGARIIESVTHIPSRERRGAARGIRRKARRGT